jgi:ubiquinone/menaquinone biosynthesis C-methylase UbiE
MFGFNKTSDLELNIIAHNKVAKRYERIHGEIYNKIEQARLRDSIGTALSYIKAGNKIKRVLDFGCGAGNLTKQLASHGCEVIACDVSQGFLELVASRNYETKVETVKLNGVDLSNIPDGSVDMVATYSVLHHVPDYLAILKEFMRVLKNGGVIYIDHELSDDFWAKSKSHTAFYSKIMEKSTNRRLGKYFVITNYIDWFVWKFINPRYRREGEIHVFIDDHIEWDKIRNTLTEAGAETVFEMSYLLFRRNYDLFVYNSYKEKINDMHMLIARKR